MRKEWTWFVAAVAVFAVGCSSAGDPGSASTGAPREAPSSPSAANGGSEAPATAKVAYSEVQAILTRSCVGCHGAKNPKEELDLTSYEGLMKGSEHGAMVKPGDPAGSKLLSALRGEGMSRMPKGMDPLPDEEIAKIEAWIAGGAHGE